MNGKPYFRTGKMRKAEIDQYVDAAESGKASKPAEAKKESAKPAMSQSEFSGYGKARRSQPPEDMMRRHRGMKEGGEVGRGFESCRGYGAARQAKRG